MAAHSAYPLEQFEPSAPPPPPQTPARLLAEAQAEADRLRELARAEGESEGRREGLEQGRAQTQAAAKALAAALEEQGRVAEQHSAALERDAVELAFALAGKVLAGTLDAEPGRVLDVVAGALRRVSDRRHVTILVDPADIDLVRDGLSAMQASAGGIECCELQADRRVGRGGAIVRTRESEVDATVLTQLERAREVVRAVLGGEEARQ
ncbi:MAG TPA: FliH/SctL family protein [Solirubrobacteraceae bacterium]|nr:FliH/SctL family protein [Solirubrobacteraceae bacterium]